MSGDVHQTDVEAQPPVSRAALFINATMPQDHAVRTVLQRLRYEVEEVADVRAAIHAARKQRFDLVVVGFFLSAAPTLSDLIGSAFARVRSTRACR